MIKLSNNIISMLSALYTQGFCECLNKSKANHIEDLLESIGVNCLVHEDCITINKGHEKIREYLN